MNLRSSSPVLHRAMIHSCSQAIYYSTNNICHGNWTKRSTVLGFLLLEDKREDKKGKKQIIHSCQGISRINHQHMHYIIIYPHHSMAHNSHTGKELLKKMKKLKKKE